MSRVMITGARAPVALHLARLFAFAGHTVFLADSQVWPLARATRHARYLRLPRPNRNLRTYGEALAAIVHIHSIDLIIPTCEEVLYLAAARDLLGIDLPLWALDFARLKNVHNKYSFAQLARFGPVTAPQTHLLSAASDLASLPAGDWIFKPVWSRFGDRVLLRPDGDALANLRPTAADPWVAQTWLPGEELCCHAVTYDGRLIVHQAYRPLWRAGRDKGAGVAVEPVSDRDIDAFVSGFVTTQAWHGHVSFDFRRDGDGRLHVIECNPRATTGAHFFTAADGLPAAMLNGAPTQASGRRALTVPLAMLIYALPQALKTGRLSQWWHDFSHMGNLLSDPDDRATWPFELLALAEIAIGAVRSGQGLKATATADIEWNGGEFI